MTYGVEYWGPALISAAGNAWSAHSTNSANQSINAASEQQAWDMYHGTQAFNKEEANINRDYNAEQAAIGRDFAHWEGQTARDYNSVEAQKAREYSTWMSNTAYQRATKDMQEAGLNPMLAYTQGGASSPPASQAQGTAAGAATASSSASSSPGGSVPSKLAMQRPDFSSVLNAASSVVGLEQQQANVELTRAQAHETASRVPQNMQQTRKMEAEIQDIIDKKPEIQARIDQMKSSTFKNEIDAEVSAAYQRLLDLQAKSEEGKPVQMQLANALTKVQTTLERYKLAEAKSTSGLWSTLSNAGEGEGGMGAAAKALMLMRQFLR